MARDTLNTITASLSGRRRLVKMLRKFLESESNRKNWKTKALSIEMWDLSVEIRREYRNATAFWETKGKTIEHICRGRYDKEGDSLLYAGFDAFARKHIPDYFSEVRRLHVPSLAEVASTLDMFLPTHYGPRTEWPVNMGELPKSDAVRLLKVVRIEGPRAKELDPWQSSCLAYRPLPSARQCNAAVWFSLHDATIHCQGFILPTRGLLIMRWAARPIGHLVASISLGLGTLEAAEVAIANVTCDLISDFRIGEYEGSFRPHSFRLNSVVDKDLQAEATTLLNFLDKTSWTI